LIKLGLVYYESEREEKNSRVTGLYEGQATTIITLSTSSCLPAVSSFSPVAASSVAAVVAVVVLVVLTMMAMSVLLLLLALSPVLPPGPVAGPLLQLLLLFVLPDLSLSCFQEMVMRTFLLVFTSCPKTAPVSKMRVKRIWGGLWTRKRRVILHFQKTTNGNSSDDYVSWHTCKGG
jgi:hypothetical protein